MSSFRLKNGFGLQENKQGRQRLETKYSTILGVFQQPWPGVSPIRHFERGEGPGDEVDSLRGISHFAFRTLSLPDSLTRPVEINSKWLRFQEGFSPFIAFFGRICSLGTGSKR